MFVFILFKVCVFFFDLPCIQSVPTHFKKIGYPSDFQCRSSYLLMPSPISVFCLFSANSTRHFQPISKTMRSLVSCCSLFAIYVNIVLIKQWTNKQLRRFFHVFLLSYLQTDVFHYPFTNLFRCFRLI